MVFQIPFLQFVGKVWNRGQAAGNKDVILLDIVEVEYPVEWDRVHVMLSDERWVPEDHERSNARMLKERLFVNRAAAAHFEPFHIPGETPARAAPALSDRLADEMPISLLLLGMGTDMHTASLFPGADGLEDALHTTEASVFATSVSGVETAQRISLTGQVLNGAMSKHLVITGAEKRDALERAQALGDPMVAPICAVLSGMTVHWAA